MDDTSGATATATPAPATPPEPQAPAAPGVALTEAIRAYFRDDRSRMTMMAARRFLVPERSVLDALGGEMPVVRLRDGAFRELMECLPGLGTVRVFVRSRAAVIESVGTFGGYSESGPFFNVQTDTLDMHILHAEVAAAYSVEKLGHDSANATYSVQFFDHAGDAAFKVFLWEDFPNVPAPRIEAFRSLTQRYAAPASAEGASPPTRPAPAAEPGRAPLPPVSEPAARLSAPARVSIPVPAGVTEGTSQVGAAFIGEESSTPAEASARPLSGRAKAAKYATRAAVAAAVLVVAGWGTYSFVVPLFWVHYEHHLRLADAPKFALTSSDVATEPLNVGLLGSENELLRGVLAAGWNPADQATFQAGLRAARAELKSRDYPRSTLTDLYLFGRRQDLLLDKPAGKDGGRHVIRLWKSDELGMGSRTLWIGSAVLERTTPAAGGGTASRKIASDRDAERDALINDLTRSLRLTETFQVTGAGPTVSGRTADGEAFFTDGELTVGSLSDKTFDRPPAKLPNPWTVRLKDQLFNELRPMLDDSGE